MHLKHIALLLPLITIKCFGMDKSALIQKSPLSQNLLNAGETQITIEESKSGQASEKGNSPLALSKDRSNFKNSFKGVAELFSAEGQPKKFAIKRTENKSSPKAQSPSPKNKSPFERAKSLPTKLSHIESPQLTPKSEISNESINYSASRKLLAATLNHASPNSKPAISEIISASPKENKKQELANSTPKVPTENNIPQHNQSEPSESISFALAQKKLALHFAGHSPESNSTQTNTTPPSNLKSKLVDQIPESPAKSENPKGKTNRPLPAIPTTLVSKKVQSSEIEIIPSASSNSIDNKIHNRYNFVALSGKLNDEDINLLNNKFELHIDQIYNSFKLQAKPQEQPINRDMLTAHDFENLYHSVIRFYSQFCLEHNLKPLLLENDIKKLLLILKPISINDNNNNNRKTVIKRNANKKLLTFRQYKLPLMGVSTLALISIIAIGYKSHTRQKPTR